MNRFSIAALLGVGLITPDSLPGQTPADGAAVDLVFAAMNRTDSPGCVVGLDRDGKAVIRRGYGMANLELGVPLGPESVLESGSVAKQFTAAAAVLLARQGKLDLDDPVRKYLPELPDYGAPITVRMLLNHTSGLRDMWTLFNLAGDETGSVLFTVDRALQMVFRQRELNFPPNSQYLYSNSGYLLLAEIIKRQSGKPLAQLGTDVFFGPLGMSKTQWRDDWNRVVPGRATAYSGRAASGWRTDMPFMSVYGAGGLLTTVGDLIRWNANLDRPVVGDQPWADSMVRRGRLTTGQEIDYALGLILTKYRGDREISHTGATGGYRTYLARFPDQRVSVAVLCNFSSAAPQSLGRKVVDIVLGRPPEAPTGTRSGPPPGGPFDPAPYVGRYRIAESEDLLTIAARDGQLVADFGADVPLVAAGPDEFRIPEADLTLTFRRDPTGRVTTLDLATDEGTRTYRRADPPASSAQELASWAGRYRSEELDVSYTLRARDTVLMLTVPNQAEVPLTRTAAGSFAAPGGVALRFTPTPRGQRGGFLLFAGRVRNLRFEKESRP